MRAIVFFACAVVVLACGPHSPGGAGSAAARHDVDAALAHYMLLLRTAPPDSTVAFYTSDGQLLEPGLALSGPAAIKAFLDPLAQTMTVSEATARSEATEVFGDTVAVQWGSYHETAGPKGAPPSSSDGRFVAEWRRTPAGWRIARFLVQPNPPPRP